MGRLMVKLAVLFMLLTGMLTCKVKKDVQLVPKTVSVPTSTSLVSLAKVCVNQADCPCPLEPMVGDKCGGGVVLKPSYTFPETPYHLIGMEPNQETDTLSTWMVANSFCDRLNRYGYQLWRLPTCGIVGQWNPILPSELAMNRDQSYCEAYFSMMIFGKLSRLYSKAYWTKSMAPNKAERKEAWTLDTRLQSASDRLENLHPFHCVRSQPINK